MSEETNTAPPQRAPKPNLLSIPPSIGRRIVEQGALLACPLYWTDRFVDFCNKRGVRVDRIRLLRLERLGLFAPVFRVRTPSRDTGQFRIPPKTGLNWFDEGWASDTTSVLAEHEVPSSSDRSGEAYYSIFQIERLAMVLNLMNLTVQMDAIVDVDDNYDWASRGLNWVENARQEVEVLRRNDYRRARALLCQWISNRYCPQTCTDQRTLQFRAGAMGPSDPWTVVYDETWDWHKFARGWDPQQTAELFSLTPNKLRHAYKGLALAQATCDPLERWHQLTQFVSLREREELKGDALRAATLRSGAQMLRMLYNDLYKEELPEPNEVSGEIFTHIPELVVRKDVRRYMEFVVNRFGLNPRPKAVLYVEGDCEERAVELIFEKYFGAHYGIYGIEVINLRGVDNATGGKADRYRALLRQIDYHHFHQTLAFMILDNEGNAKKLQQQANRLTSIHVPERKVTRPEYIKVWKKSWEFDNFSNTEIAVGMTAVADGNGSFSAREIEQCRTSTRPGPGKALSNFYKAKTGYELPKLKLTEHLLTAMGGGRRKIKSRPIIKFLDKVATLASRNPFPIMQETWETNQSSAYFGKVKRAKSAKKK